MKLDHVSSQIILAASKEAASRKHEYVTPEHILYSALFYEEGSNIIHHCGGNIETLQADLNEYLNNHIPKTKGNAPLESKGFQNVLNNTALHAINSGQDIIAIGDIFISIYQEKDSFALYCLQKQGIDKLDILNYICHGISQVNSSEQNDEESIHQEKGSYANKQKSITSQVNTKKIHSFFKQFTTDLTEQAQLDQLDPVIGRDDLIERTIQTLCRRIKNNPIHVGDPGIGKTAITEGLATWIVKNQVPDVLKKHKILLLDMNAVVAGTKYRGEFEERLQLLLRTISKMNNVILYIDEIHTIVGAGAVSGGSMDASNILKPFLSKSHIKCIGSTTYEEYKKYFDKDKALSRRFQKIEVNEPSSEECVQILHGLKSKYEQFHNTTYSKEAIQTAVDLAVKYIHDRFLPDKAIDVLDEAGAFLKLRTSSKGKKQITQSDIEKTVSLMTKMPLETVSTNEVTKLKTLSTKLKKQIFGQDAAIDKLVQAIQQSRAGFNDDHKPIASLFFVGPTGVGKTELTQQLAQILGIPCIRFDMSEYQEKHSISKLIGSPPGYVGYEEGGLLIDQIRLHPHSVLLLDEIEKAHPDIFNMLLQVMDYATLTDKTGKKADFRNVILIMTSNAGAKELGKTLLGFDNRKLDSGIMSKEINTLFSPEFRNRLTQVITFNQLNKDMSLKIVKKALSVFQSKLNKKNIQIQISSSVYTWLAQKGLSSEFGARAIHRLIEDEIKKSFVQEVLFRKLKDGGQARISILNNSLTITIDTEKLK